MTVEEQMLYLKHGLRYGDRFKLSDKIWHKVKYIGYNSRCPFRMGMEMEIYYYNKNDDSITVWVSDADRSIEYIKAEEL